jgi:hypothetical protein
MVGQMINDLVTEKLTPKAARKPATLLDIGRDLEAAAVLAPKRTRLEDDRLKAVQAARRGTLRSAAHRRRS